MRKELSSRLSDIDKASSQMGKEQRKLDKSHSELRTKLKNLKIELETKVSDTEDEILAELEKVKLLAETANSTSQVQDNLFSTDVPGRTTDVATEKPAYQLPAVEQFKVRNQIQDMWKSLRLDIAHRKLVPNF